MVSILFLENMLKVLSIESLIIEIIWFCDLRMRGWNYVTFFTGAQWVASSYLMLLNGTPIKWYSKRQNCVETSTYGSEMVAGRIVVDAAVELRYEHGQSLSCMKKSCIGLFLPVRVCGRFIQVMQYPILVLKMYFDNGISHRLSSKKVRTKSISKTETRMVLFTTFLLTNHT